MEFGPTKKSNRPLQEQKGEPVISLDDARQALAERMEAQDRLLVLEGAESGVEEGMQETTATVAIMDQAGHDFATDSGAQRVRKLFEQRMPSAALRTAA